MRREIILAWLKEVYQPSAINNTAQKKNHPSESPPKAPTENRTKKRHRLLSPPMSSTSSKRQRLEPPDQESPDEETPRPTRTWAAPVEDDLQTSAPPTIGTPSLLAITPNPGLNPSKFAHAITVVADSPTTPRRHPRLSQSPTKSPSKVRKTEHLRLLTRPVQVQHGSQAFENLPEDVSPLFKKLRRVHYMEQILPPELREYADFTDPDEIRPFMWKEPLKGAVCTDDGALFSCHSTIKRILADATKSSDLSRSEAAWNAWVHLPALRHFVETSSHDRVAVEMISTARVAAPFRPLLRDNISVSSASSMSSNSRFDSEPGRPVASGDEHGTSSAHRMVDFALVLEPKDAEGDLVDNFVKSQTRSHATINQTLYEPLRNRPAPVFIETKTNSGSADEATAQLGVWVAAWYERFNAIAALCRGRSETDRLIALPLLQIVGGKWTVLFAVDRGNEIHILDRGFGIGGTNSLLEMYQAQAGIHALCDWMEDTFRPWLSKLLTDVQGG